MKRLKKQFSTLLLMVMLITCFSPVSAFAKTEAQAKSNNTVKQVQEKPYEESDFFISGTTFNGLTPAGKTKLQENNGKLVFPSLKSRAEDRFPISERISLKNSASKRLYFPTILKASGTPRFTKTR